MNFTDNEVILLKMNTFFPTKTLKHWSTQVRSGRPSN